MLLEQLLFKQQAVKLQVQVLVDKALNKEEIINKLLVNDNKAY
jgi:hypothetical protein